jgi:endonuclease/exonuclease/phosphatase family metal-dependent hydrolase
MGRERRVAVLATVTPRGGRPLRVVAAHLDVLIGATAQAQRLADYLVMHPTDAPTVVGVDTNAITGTHSGAVRALNQVAPRIRQCGSGRTNVWLARIDFFFATLPRASVSRCETLHERYGSDHVPQVLSVDAE